MFRKICYAVTMGATLSNVAFAQVNVSVNANGPGRTVDERVFGVNSVMWDAGTSTQQPNNLQQTIDLVQAAGVRTIRLPGGSNSDEYHWYINTPYTQKFHWVSGFNFSSALIRSISPQANAFVTVNYGTGTAQEAAAWVAYANFSTSATDVPIGTGIEFNGNYNGNGNQDFKTASYWANLRASTTQVTPDDGQNFLRIGLTAPMNFKYWEIGNEEYGTWETDLHAIGHDPYTYATQAASYITLMKQVDPTIKVGVVAEVGEDTYNINTTTSNSIVSNHPNPFVTNPRTSAQHNGWTPLMLTKLKQLGVTPDFLIYHRYEQAAGAESDAGLLQAASSWPQDAANLRQQLSDYLGAAGTNIELVVTENNSVSTNPGKQSTSLVNGLYLADSIGNVLQTEFNGLMWWALRNDSPKDDNGNLLGNQSSSLYGWRMYGDYGMLSYVDSTTGVNTFFTGYPTYYAMKLLSLFARGGDNVISVSSDNSLLAAYGAKRSDDSVSLLVINKSPTATTSAQFALTGVTPSMPVNVYSYGMANDNAANPLIGSGCMDITSSSISTPAATFTTSFAPYSINVLTFNRAAAMLANIAPAIVSSPSNKNVVPGATTSFSVGASACPVPAYQWQRMASGSSTWQDLSDDDSYSGTATATLSVITTLAMSGDQFRAVATSGANNINSAAATLTVSAASSSSSSVSVTTGAGSSGGGGGGTFDLLTVFAMLSFSGLRKLAKKR